MKSNSQKYKSGTVYINNKHLKSGTIPTNDKYREECITPDQEILLCIKFEKVLFPATLMEVLSDIAEKKSGIFNKHGFHYKYDKSEPTLNGKALDLDAIENKKYSSDTVLKKFNKNFEPLSTYIKDGTYGMLKYALKNGIKIAIFTKSPFFDLVEKMVADLGFSEHYSRLGSNDIIIISGEPNIKQCIKIATSHYEITNPKNVYFLSDEINMLDLHFNGDYVSPISIELSECFYKTIIDLQVHLSKKQDYIDNYKIHSNSTPSCEKEVNLDEIKVIGASTEDSC